MYERHQAQLDLYAKLAEAEADIVSGSDSTGFFEFVKKQRVYNNE